MKSVVGKLVLKFLHVVFFFPFLHKWENFCLKLKIQSKKLHTFRMEGFQKYFLDHFSPWTSQSGAKSMFLNISRDIFKNTLMAPLREVHHFEAKNCNF